jgi:putative hydrolase of the HAD superfamily
VGQNRQLRKIEILELHQLTSCVFVSQLFGSEKPDAAIFLAAAAHLHVSPDKVLFVGDNPYNDVWGAHRVGMRTAWLQRAHPWPSILAPHLADMTIWSLQDLVTGRYLNS